MTETAAPAAARVSRRGLAVALLNLAAIAVILFTTMPTSAIRGDPFAVRIEAAHWLVAGSLGVSYDLREHIAPFVRERGQYFYENDTRRRYYSKYGFLNTILFLPPMAVYHALTGRVNAFDWSGPFVFVLNLYHLCVGLGIAVLLYRLARGYAPSRLAAWLFVYFSMFCTFLWFYVRAQSSEVFQVFFFLLAFAGWVTSGRASDRAGAMRGAALAGVAVACLVLLKTYYVLLLPIGLAWQLFASRGRSGYRWPALVAFLLPAAAGICILALVNQVKFESPLHTGYGQFAIDRFHAWPQPEVLWGFLVSPDRSIFVHFPLLLLALPAWWRPARRDAGEWSLAVAVLGVSILGVSFFGNWEGHWSYGPRYALFALPAAALPAARLIQAGVDGCRRPMGFAILVALFAIGAWAASAQLAMNRLPFFTGYDAQNFFRLAEDPDVDAYFENRNFALVHRDLLAWRDQDRPFPAIALVQSRQTPEQYAALEQTLKTMLWSNIFWFQDVSQTRLGGSRPGLPEVHDMSFPPEPGPTPEGSID